MTPITAYADVLIANQRANPTHRSELVNQILFGHTLQIIDREGDWYYCKSEHPYQGWIEKKEIYIPAEPSVLTSTALYYRKIFGTISLANNTVTKATLGMCLYHLEANEYTSSLNKHKVAQNPIRAIDHRGQTYLLEPDDWQTLPTPPNISTQPMVQHAQNMMHAPYLWGGTSALAPDCSGMVWLAAFMAGIALPRDASQQAQIGHTIEYPGQYGENLLPGDLLFFAEPGKNISHVAISLGNGAYIHASGRVTINHLHPQHTLHDASRLATWVLSKRLCQ